MLINKLTNDEIKIQKIGNNLKAMSLRRFDKLLKYKRINKKIIQKIPPS